MSAAPADHADDRMPTKSSWGVILCRRNPATGRPEALLVHKRYTYAFSDFIHGRYACGRPPPGIVPPPRTVAELLDDMTREELFLVWSLEFGSMWYHVWLTCENRELYGRKHAKFQSSFMRDGGANLRAQVTRAHARGALLWEVPKGRRLSAREADIICSVRETREETGIDKGEYRLLPGVKRRVSYVSGRVRYICVYYIALAYPRLTESNHCCTRWLSILRSIHQMAEVSEVRWCDIEHLRLLDEGSNRLEALIKPAFRLVKIYNRGRWAARRANPHRADDCDAILHDAEACGAAPPPAADGAAGAADAVAGGGTVAARPASFGAEPTSSRPRARSAAPGRGRGPPRGAPGPPSATRGPAPRGRGGHAHGAPRGRVPEPRPSGARGRGARPDHAPEAPVPSTGGPPADAADAAGWRTVARRSRKNEAAPAYAAEEFEEFCREEAARATERRA